MTFLYPNVQVNQRVIFFLLMLIVASARGTAQDIQLSSSKSGISHDGHIKLQWESSRSDTPAVFEVQQATDEDFRDATVIYQGPDLGTFISGLKNGTYYFRVRAEDRDWSNVLRLEVAHHSLTLTFVLLGLGGIVFLCTAGMVIYGARKSAQIQ